MISDLMLKDSIDRNVKKLTNLKSKIVLLQQILFGSNDTSCEDISTVVNLAPAALDSFQFLDECIIDRNAQVGHRSLARDQTVDIAPWFPGL